MTLGIAGVFIARQALGGIPFRLAWEAESVAAGLAATVPPALFALYAVSKSGLRWRLLKRTHDQIKEFMGGAIKGSSLPALSALALAAGIGEEILFRGTLVPLWGWVAANLLFAAAHAINPALFSVALLLGFYLTWLHQATGNLLAPILVHWLYDTLALYLYRRRFRRLRP